MSKVFYGRGYGTGMLAAVLYIILICH